MRLLITRPLPDALRTAERLRELGHDAIGEPLLTVTFLLPPAELPTPRAILLTSQNAVRAVEMWPQAAQWSRIPVFVAGPATARAAAAIGFADVRGAARDAGSLADKVIAELAPNSGPLLYPAARDRAGALAGGLLKRGYDIRVVEAYRADATTRFSEAVAAALAGGTIDGVLLYSRRTAMAFRDCAAAAGVAGPLSTLDFYVISEQVAEVLDGISRRYHVAEHPVEDSLLALIPPVR